MVQRAKQVGVEQFSAKRAVEAFDVGILGRLAGLNPVQGNALRLAPFAQARADGFGAIVLTQLRRPAMALN